MGSESADTAITVPIQAENINNGTTKEEFNLYLSSYWKHDPGLTLIYILAYGVVTVLALLGNLLVVVAVYNTPSMQSSVNILIVNMSVGGILYAVFVLPTSLLQIVYYDWFLGAVMCKATAYIQGVVVTSVIYTLIAIAIDRYIAICGKLHANMMSKRTTLIVMLVIWSLAAAIMTPYAIHYEAKRFAGVEPPVTGCGPCIDWPNFDVYFTCVVFLANYTIPLCLITFCYASIAVKVWRKDKEFGSSRHIRRDVTCVGHGAETTWRLVKMMIMIVVLFAFSWLPLYTIRMLSISQSNQEQFDSESPPEPEPFISATYYQSTNETSTNPTIGGATSSGKYDYDSQLSTSRLLPIEFSGNSSNFGTTSLTNLPAMKSASVVTDHNHNHDTYSNGYEGMNLLNDLLIPLSQWLSSSNCCMNPWVYCFFSPKYRRAFKRIVIYRLFGKFCSDREVSESDAQCKGATVRCAKCKCSYLTNRQHYCDHVFKSRSKRESLNSRISLGGSQFDESSSSLKNRAECISLSLRLHEFECERERATNHAKRDGVSFHRSDMINHSESDVKLLDQIDGHRYPSHADTSFHSVEAARDNFT